MELRAAAALLYGVGNLGMALFFGLTLLDDPLGVLDRDGVWRVLWYAGAVVGFVGIGLGIGLGLLLGLRDRKRQTAG